ncbi:uncharacterized protein BDZ99DRAFT_27083 [Mytilinidion resinicola]|uniref:Uncharacterized protein n=1 Tax=Mytilinidion resinicola TaxID=574789 RepID=A0A6A6YMV6_9PEZI|nr:uncharacterized protein BDZ99DRAFT_27083 [Mytilinidion resinicola]KAF2809334.1 hypothetical protein BDZ99DRAFT_27083 [Mytilinidion resinicola]
MLFFTALGNKISDFRFIAQLSLVPLGVCCSYLVQESGRQANDAPPFGPPCSCRIIRLSDSEMRCGGAAAVFALPYDCCNTKVCFLNDGVSIPSPHYMSVLMRRAILLATDILTHHSSAFHAVLFEHCQLFEMMNCSREQSGWLFGAFFISAVPAYLDL